MVNQWFVFCFRRSTSTIAHGQIMFQSTAIYPNRIKDKKLLEACMKVSEQGDETTEFKGVGDSFRLKGYTRIVYGDHGPYLEFEQRHLQCKLKSIYNQGFDPNNLPENSKFYYYWLTPEMGVGIKIYLQIKSVSDLPNAPKRADGEESKFNRAEGYADYRRGFYYVSPWELMMIKPKVELK